MRDFYKQFDLYNDLIFDGAVPPCQIFVEKKLSKRAMGYFWGNYDEHGNKTYTIELSEAYDNLGLVLIHEMIHALQWKLDRGVNHRSYFKQWKRWIHQEFGLDI